jgi:uncharacterized protein YecE (DUF72 family)
MTASGRIRVGIGGWVFPPWRGAFYPPGLRQADELGYASRHVTAIEINGTFYRLQSAQSFRRWRDETPEDFVFSLKGPRFITHRKDFGEIGPALDRFFGSGLLDLGDKLGPILWQFSPRIPIAEDSFAAFLKALPCEIDGCKLRHVAEIRVPGGIPEKLVALLRHHKAALAFVDDDNFPARELTGDFVYARLRRCEAEEPAGYSPEALDNWAREFAELSAKGGRDCFVYFINGAKQRAPAAAQALLRRLQSPR